jgi:choline-glycine betaine transporter
MIGTVSSLGLLGIQAGAGLDALFGISGNFTNQLWLLLGLVVIYTLSAKSGAVRGIQFMSCVSVLLGGALALFILTQGPSDFVLKAFPEAMTGYAEHFLAMSMLSDDSGWLDSWTLFYWGWFIGYAPLMGMFVARISRGRTIRQMILVIAVLAPLVTCLWFTILGGSGLAFELLDPGSISDPMSNDLGIMAGVFGVTQQLPYSTLCAAGFLLLFILTMAIKSDAMILALSMVMTGNGHPENVVRIPIGLMIGLIAAFLVLAGGFSLLSPVSVIIAVPISLLLLPSLWYAPFIARRMAREQGI